ncbi:hypothetical protein DAEQUDRAFT_813961 [Daedalea quercina L-15889]|uniref:Uncharacterized protein n=1 Tax=Daedalea quercina L-15889 TaxID=1314783 RepID=A0A165MMC7_9APHY|nr:hypothetical protein DAEQUDRAFT_813961 [Daedalea quercina L-15889]
MRPAFLQAAFAAVLALSAYGQTVTTTNELGLTVVEVITLDPLGLATTETLSTLTGRTTTTAITTTPTTTSPATTSTTTTQNAGAVEDSPTAIGVTQTVYTYTTTDAAGNTVAVEATFTPSFAPTTTPTPTGSGTILDYSQWIASASTAAASSAAPRQDLSWLFGGLGSILAIMGGGIMVLA